jgi:eukaryotic-like serine/threonine-protein kinase
MACSAATCLPTFPPFREHGAMATLVTCRHGHRWEVGVRGAVPGPRLVCPICGSAPEGLVDHGTILSATAELTEPQIEITRLTDGPPPAIPDPAPPRHRIGNYEVLEVLGRGGMGVVYKVFQPSLKRVVALKMILDSSADLQGLTRFRTEAEAVAQLQHPNITQIHEIGDHEGQPFLSLEYVDGGTLAKKLARTMPAPREAAQLMEVLARAMHFAHQRGIIHRDLKPTNVLLTKEGQPKISDFGLAKRTQLDSSSGAAAMTQTGEVLGTPSYMAPEQAGGLIRLIGPATDIYSLGALLYEMLTGNPPFVAGSAVHVLHRVLYEEPVAPTKAQPRVPRDLETICLTCLEKSPARRYASAEALADDLRAFLAGDPIKARPPTPWERLTRWARRRPTTAVLLVVAAIACLGLLLGAWQHNALVVGSVAVLSLLLAAWWYNARLQTALRDLAHEHREAEHNVERLHFLLEATRQLMAAPDVNALLTILGETAARLVNAERSTIYMLDSAAAELWSRTAMGDGVGEIRVPLGTGISGMVALTGETIVLDDPYSDPRFNPDVDKRTGYRTRNLLTMPVKSGKGTILGVFQLLNKRQGNFDRGDVELLTTLAASAAVALANTSKMATVGPS